MKTFSSALTLEQQHKNDNKKKEFFPELKEAHTGVQVSVTGHALKPVPVKEDFIIKVTITT